MLVRHLFSISFFQLSFFDVFQAEEYVPLPKGDVHKKKELVQDVTLHDLDVANARPQVGHLLSYR